MIRDELQQLISEKRACLGVIGLGYVGLPLIVEFCLKGFNAIGFEVDEAKASGINAGRSYIVDVSKHPMKRINLERAARHAAERDFDWDVIAQRQAELYESLRQQ